MSAVETSDTPFEVAFKPALVGSRATWKLDGTKLYKNGSLAADLASVQSGHWLQMRQRGVETRGLKLKSAQGSVSINVNGTAGQDDFRSFYKLALAAMARTAVHSPNARINMGGGLATMIMLFVLGVVFLAMGGACAVLAFGMGVGENPAVLGIFGMAIAAFGGWLAFAMRPWDHHRLSVPPARALAAIIGN